MTSSVRINGIDYPCHEEVAKMFKVMWEDGQITTFKYEVLQAKYNKLKKDLLKVINNE